VHRGAANDRRAHPGRAGVSRGAADREHGGRRRAHAGAAAERALPPGLYHGGVSDLADLPRRAHDRERARRPQGRQARGQRRRRLRDLQGHHVAGALGRRGATRREFEKMMMAAMKRALAAAAVLLAATFVAGGEEAKPELSRVRLAVGGKPALFYLPLTVTERLRHLPAPPVRAGSFPLSWRAPAPPGPFR